MNSQKDYLEKIKISKVKHNNPPAEEIKKENVLPVGKNPSSKKSVRFFDFIISLSFVAIFLGLPLFFTGRTLQGIYFEKQIYFYFWLLIALVAWIIKGVMSGELKVKRTPLDFPIILVWIVYALSCIFSVDKWHSFWGSFGDPSRSLIAVTGLIFFYYILVTHLNGKRLKWILGSLVASLSIIVLWSFLYVFGWLPAKLTAYYPFSPIGSITGLAIILGVYIPLLISVIFKTKISEKLSNIKKNIFISVLSLLLVLDLILIFALHSYNSWAALLIGMGMLVIYIVSRIVRPGGNLVWIPMAVFVLLSAFLMVGNEMVKLARINLPLEVSPAYKLSAEVAKNSLRKVWIVGSGPGTYGYDFSLNKPESFNINPLYNIRFNQAKGIIFESISTLGAAGSILVIILLLSFISISIYLLTREKEKNKAYSLGLAVASFMLLVFSVSAILEGSIFIIGSLVGSLAMAVFLYESISEENYFNLSLKASPKYALSLAFIFMIISLGVVFLFVFIGKAYAADIYAGRINRSQDKAENIKNLSRAINLFGKEGFYKIKLGQQYAMIANDELLKSDEEKNINNVQQYLTNAIAYAQQGSDVMKKDISAIEATAQIYENAGFYVGESLNLAEEYYKKGLDLDPYSPNLYLKLGGVKISKALISQSQEDKKKLLEEAKDFFQKSVEKKSDFSEGYYQLASSQEALGNFDSAIDNMSKALRYNNGNLNYALNLGRLYKQRGKNDDYDIAQQIFKGILAVNDKDLNTHLNLGLLYEKMNKKDEAVSQYQEMIDILPSDQQTTKDQINKMIFNVRNGVENTPENLK